MLLSQSEIELSVAGRLAGNVDSEPLFYQLEDLDGEEQQIELAVVSMRQSSIFERTSSRYIQIEFTK
jgi:hypothetical protein